MKRAKERERDEMALMGNERRRKWVKGRDFTEHVNDAAEVEEGGVDVRSLAKARPCGSVYLREKERICKCPLHSFFPLVDSQSHLNYQIHLSFPSLPLPLPLLH